MGVGGYEMSDITVQVKAHEQEWRREAHSRGRYPYSINDDQDLMTSWLDVGGLRKREECGVTPMFLGS